MPPVGSGRSLQRASSNNMVQPTPTGALGENLAAIDQLLGELENVKGTIEAKLGIGSGANSGPAPSVVSLLSSADTSRQRLATLLGELATINSAL